MTTRREFLQAGIAASALPAIGGLPSDRSPDQSTADATPAVSFHTAVFDERFPESVAFAAEMARLGVATRGIKGDMTALWYHELQPVWSSNPVAIAGLTAHGPLFCLERLAWDHGMRVRFRAEHQFRPDGCVEHSISASGNVLDDASVLGAAGNAWGAQVARLLDRCAQRPESTTRIVVTRLQNPVHLDREPLFSWVIAPVVRAEALKNV